MERDVHFVLRSIICAWAKEEIEGLIQDEVLHNKGSGKLSICGRNIDQTWTGGKSILQLELLHFEAATKAIW
jgi:hypothetical protein